MNSILKKDLPTPSLGETLAETLAETLGEFDYLREFKKKIDLMNTINDVSLIHQKLKFLGLNYDPFLQHSEQEIFVRDECQQILKELHLTEYMNNPYEVTNLLLRLIDLTEEKLHLLQQ